MRPYGLRESPRGVFRYEYMDKQDIALTGAPSRYGGQQSKRKRRTRRFIKGHARRAGKVACNPDNW